MSIVEKFMTMEYGPRAGGSARSSCLAGPSWPALRTFHKRRVAGARGGDLFRDDGSFHGRKTRDRGAGSTFGRRQRGESRARCFAAWQSPCLRIRAPAISMHWPGRCRNIRAGSRFSKHWDNGKPIRESRDIDIPLVARHFYHHAGWPSCSSRNSRDIPLAAS